MIKKLLPALAVTLTLAAVSVGCANESVEKGRQTQSETAQFQRESADKQKTVREAEIQAQKLQAELAAREAEIQAQKSQAELAAREAEIQAQKSQKEAERKLQVEEPLPNQNVALQVQAQNCSPAYPDICLPPATPDLDCKDISQLNFRVLPPDPHKLDKDGDGIGCEEKNR